MNKLINIVLVAFVLAILSSVVHANSLIQQCPDENFPDLPERVAVTPCKTKNSRCKLTQGTDTNVEIKFMLKHEVKSLNNDVTADILGIPLPFIGVHGTSACSDITRADTGEAAPCPLKPDVEYIYKNTFHIENFYPITNLKVHWGLIDGDKKKNVMCFEVPAAITAPKGKKTNS